MSMHATSCAIAQLPKKKLFYRINEVAKLTGVKPYVLRYWESEFPDLAPEKDASDQRRYRAKDIEIVLVIRKLLYEDRFTIKGARAQIKQELKAVRRGSVPLELKPETPAETREAEIVEMPLPTPVAIAAEPERISETPRIEPRTMRTPSLYQRALSENLSRLKKDVSELLDLLSA